MNINGLSFNALPPIDLPFRFFITAVLFIILSAFLVLFSGEQLWLSRWHPNMLALTHGFMLGFVSSVMMGALLQLLPVLGGIGFVKPRLIAGSCHFFHLLGTLSLMITFIFPSTLFFSASLVFLSLGLGGYITATVWVLIKKLSQGDSIIGIRFAVAAFAVALLLSLFIQAGKMGYLTNDITNNLAFIQDKSLTNLHALWGLIGWASLLIISVSFQVIPMFHVSPAFQPFIRYHLVWLIFTLLIFFAVFPTIALPIIVILHGIFALALLVTISKRKRKVPDTTIRYWQLGAGSLLVLNGIYFLPEALINQLPEQLSEQLSTTLINKKSMIMAAIFIYFYLVSIIQGMLLKIMPFLSYTHLQQRCMMNFSAMPLIPHMHEFLAKKHANLLFIFHLLTGLALIGTLLVPALYGFFGSLLLIEFSGLLFLMIKTIRLYNITNSKIKQLDKE